MKHLTKVLFIVLAVVCFSNVNAQDKDNRWIVEIGTNVVDFYPTDADPGIDNISPENPIEPVPEPFDESNPPLLTGGMFSDFFNNVHIYLCLIIYLFNIVLIYFIYL